MFFYLKAIKLRIKISIIVPCFNLENHVIDTLISLFHIADPLIEIIIINDGSSDSTKEQIENFLITNPINNCRFIQTKNNGLSKTRNIGIDLAVGEFLFFLDGDDCIIPGSLTDIIKILDDNIALDLIAFQGYDIEDRVVFCPKTFSLNNDLYLIESYNRFVEEKVFLDSNDYIMNQVLNGVYLSNVCFYFIKRKCLKKIRFIPAILYEDIPFTLELFLSNLKLVVISNRLIIHRRRFGSITRSLKDVLHIRSLFLVSERLLVLGLLKKKNLLNIVDNSLKQGLRASVETENNLVFLHPRWLWIIMYRSIFSTKVRKEFKKILSKTLKKNSN